MAAVLPLLSDIDSSHIEQIEAILAERTAHAPTDSEALQIAQNLLSQVRGGLTFDEEGNEVRLLGEEDWSDQQIEAQAQVTAGGDDREKKKREAIIYGVGFILVAVIGLWFLLGGGDEGSDETAQTEPDPAVGVAVEPGVAERLDTLALGDTLGGRIKLGQPRTLEVLPAGNDQSYTMAVVIAPVDDDGVLPIADEMRDGDLVAEWVFGTVVNYSFGLPEAVINNLQPGTRAVIRTTTGATYQFVCSEKTQNAPQETEMFSQTRPGLTLFPLPSTTSPVPVLWCPYDPTMESVTELANSGGIGQEMSIDNVNITVESLTVNEMIDGQISVVAKGQIQAVEGNGTVIINLDSPIGRYSPLGDQYMAVEAKHEWIAEFILPGTYWDLQTTLDIRSPTGGSAQVSLGKLSNPRSNAQISVDDVSWDETIQEVNLSVSVFNKGDVGFRLTQADVSAYWQGGDVFIRQISPLLPIVVPGNQQVPIDLNLVSSGQTSNFNIQVLDTLWEIQGVPVEQQ